MTKRRGWGTAEESVHVCIHREHGIHVNKPLSSSCDSVVRSLLRTTPTSKHKKSQKKKTQSCPLISCLHFISSLTTPSLTWGDDPQRHRRISDSRLHSSRLLHLLDAVQRREQRVHHQSSHDRAHRKSLGCGGGLQRLEHALVGHPCGVCVLVSEYGLWWCGVVLVCGAVWSGNKAAWR